MNHDDFKTVHAGFKLSSVTVEDGVLLEAYRCERKTDGVENSLPLSWENVPDGTQSLAVIMYHYPKQGNKSEVNAYLLLWGIDPGITKIPYKMARDGSWFIGANKDGAAVSYSSPCSKGKGKHEYIVALYALSEMPATLPTSSSVAVDYNAFMEAISTVEIVDGTTL